MVVKSVPMAVDNPLFMYNDLFVRFVCVKLVNSETP